MIKDQRGSITVFSAMVFLAMLLFISLCVEGVYQYVGKGKAMGAYMASLSHTRGNYQKELEEQYHLFALDWRYAKNLTKDVKDKMAYSLEQSEDTYRFQVGEIKLGKKVYLTDQKGEVLKYQIREWMKYQATTDVLSACIDRVKGAKKGEAIGQAKLEMKDDEDAAKEEEKANKDKEDKEDNKKKDQPKEEKKDPRKGLLSLLHEGSVSLVLGKKKVSNQTIAIRYGKEDKSKTTTANFMKKKSTTKEMDKVEKELSKDDIFGELPVFLYINRYFHCLTSSDKKDGPQYEIEYLIGGKSSDKENLGTVFWRMIALRWPINLAYVYTNVKLKEEATAMATAIASIFALPPLIAVAKHLLLISLAYGESIIDVRNLANGKKTPLVKSEATWQMSFAGLATLNAKERPPKTGLTYGDYLMILFLLQGNKRDKYLRMMDLIEQNVRQKAPDFRLNQCPASYEVGAKVSLSPLGFGGIALPFSMKQQWNLKRISSY